MHTQQGQAKLDQAEKCCVSSGLLVTPHRRSHSPGERMCSYCCTCTSHLCYVPTQHCATLIAAPQCMGSIPGYWHYITKGQLRGVLVGPASTWAACSVRLHPDKRQGLAQSHPSNHLGCLLQPDFVVCSRPGSLLLPLSTESFTAGHFPLALSP